MTRLEILELRIEDHRWQAKVAPEFRREFESANLILPTVRTLIFSRYFEWLVFKCPNARKIQTKDRWFHNDLFDSLIKTVAIVKDLEYFEINAWQDERLAQGIFVLSLVWWLSITLMNHSSCSYDATLEELGNSWRFHLQ